MNKKILMFALVPFLSLGMAISVSMANSKFMAFNSMDFVGATVRDSHGEFVGVVNGVRVNSGGQASAVVTYYDLHYSGGVDTLVPLSELRIAQTKKGQETAFLKTEKEYGIQPYWIENGTPRENRSSGLNSIDLVGAAVEDSCGKPAGIVNEVMIDSDSHAFVVVNHGDYDLAGSGGINTPLPFQEIQVTQSKAGQDTVVLKTDMEHLDFAPYLNPLKRETRQDEARIYEYYGIQPSWTQSGERSK